MALTTEGKDWLEHVVGTAQDNRKDLSDWENDFMADQANRFEEYGESVRFSVKQWAIVVRIATKLGIPTMAFGTAYGSGSGV